MGIIAAAVAKTLDQPRGRAGKKFTALFHVDDGKFVATGVAAIVSMHKQ